MINQETAHRNFGSVEQRFASIVGDARDFSLLRVAREEARDALVRTQEDAAIEAQDVLAQAAEALVMG